MLTVFLSGNEAALREHISNEIKAAAARHDIQPVYLAAIAYQESVQGSNSLFDAIVAHREEEQFFLKRVFNKALTGFIYKSMSGVPNEYSERRARASSWGIMQCLGATAREVGYDRQYLSSLVFPEIGIEYGARIFKKKLDAASGDYYKATLLYNGGSDPEYPIKILGHIRTGNYKRVLIES